MVSKVKSSLSNLARNGLSLKFRLTRSLIDSEVAGGNPLSNTFQGYVIQKLINNNSGLNTTQGLSFARQKTFKVPL